MASTRQKQQYRTQGTINRQIAKTAGHAARRQIDLDYSRQRRQDSRRERAEEEKFKGRLPIWGARNPYTEQYEFRPGAKEGFWENRATDWTGKERDAAPDQAEWTKIQHPLVKRQPNTGFGFFGGMAVDAIQGRLQRRGQQQQQGPGQPLPPPQGLPAPSPAGLPGPGGAGPGPGGAGQAPRQARVKANPVPKPNSGQPAGPGLNSGMGQLPSGVLGLPAPGGSMRQPGTPRRLPSNTGRPALGRGTPALGAGSPYPDAIEATASDTPTVAVKTAAPRRKAGMGNWGKDRVADELEGTEEIVSPSATANWPKRTKNTLSGPLQSIGNPWGDMGTEEHMKRIPGTPVQSIGNPWAYDPRD